MTTTRWPLDTRIRKTFEWSADAVRAMLCHIDWQPVRYGSVDATRALQLWRRHHQALAPQHQLDTGRVVEGLAYLWTQEMLRLYPRAQFTMQRDEYGVAPVLHIHDFCAAPLTLVAKRMPPHDWDGSPFFHHIETHIARAQRTLDARAR